MSIVFEKGQLVGEVAIDALPEVHGGAWCLHARRSVDGALLELRHCADTKSCQVVLIQQKLVALHRLDIGSSAETAQPLAVNMSLMFYRLPKALLDEPSLPLFKAFAELPPDEQQQVLHLVDATVRRDAYEDGLLVQSSCPEAVDVVDKAGVGRTTVAAAAFRPGDVVFACRGVVLPFPTVYTLCVGIGRHLLFQCDAQCLAHSCDPNTEIKVRDSDGDEDNDDAAAFRVVAVREIPCGEVLSFNYLTTEWSMSEPFDCECGASACAGKIAGYKHCSPQVRESLQEKVSPAIAALAAKEWAA